MKKSLARGRIFWGFWKSCVWLLAVAFHGSMSRGQRVSEFEHLLCAFFDARQVFLVYRARLAFKILLEHLSLRPGDKVLLPPITIKAMGDVVLGLNLKPIFCDLDMNTLVFDEEKLKNVLEHDKPKVALVTPLFGNSFDGSAMATLLRKNDCVPVIDISQGFQSCFKGIPIWKGFDYAICSFSAIKSLDSLGGGALFSPIGRDIQPIGKIVSKLNRPSRANLISVGLRNLVFSVYYREPFTSLAIFLFRFADRFKPGVAVRQTGERSKTPERGIPDVLERGFSEAQAEIGITALKDVEKFVRDRKTVATKLISGLEHLGKSDHIPRGLGGADSDYWQFLFFSETPEVHQRHFWKFRIDTGATSLSFLPDIFCAKSNVNPLEGARKIYWQSIFLPCYPGLNDFELSRILDAVAAMDES